MQKQLNCFVYKILPLTVKGNFFKGFFFLISNYNRWGNIFVFFFFFDLLLLHYKMMVGRNVMLSLQFLFRILAPGNGKKLFEKNIVERRNEWEKAFLRE